MIPSPTWGGYNTLWCIILILRNTWSRHLRDSVQKVLEFRSARVTFSVFNEQKKQTQTENSQLLLSTFIYKKAYCCWEKFLNGAKLYNTSNHSSLYFTVGLRYYKLLSNVTALCSTVLYHCILSHYSIVLLLALLQLNIWSLQHLGTASTCYICNLPQLLINQLHNQHLRQVRLL